MNQTKTPYANQDLAKHPIFFASSNSAGGFHNDYPTLFGDGSDVDTLYVIKGGPGTGKSHFIKVVARYAEALGYAPVYYACSSDPYSMDGVKLTRHGSPTIGLLDGTSPHVFEPTLPGVREEILNLGEFWSSQKLKNHADIIQNLSQSKANAYRMAYNYLAAAGEGQVVAEGYLSPCIHKEKLQNLARRLTEDIPNGEKFVSYVGHLCGVGMSGFAYLDTYRGMAERVVEIETYYGIGYVLMEMIYAKLMAKKSRLYLSRHPIYTRYIDGIYLPDSGVAYLITSPHHPNIGNRTPDRVVSPARYSYPHSLKENRPYLRHAMQLVNALEEGAVQCLREAGRYHFELEKVYAAAMDFSAKERYTRAFCERVFGVLGR